MIKGLIWKWSLTDQSELEQSDQTALICIEHSKETVLFFSRGVIQDLVGSVVQAASGAVMEF